MSDQDSARALDALRNPDAGMTEVLKALSVLDSSADFYRTLRVGITSNVTVDLLASYLRRHAYLSGVRLEIVAGSYDDLVNDVANFVKQDVEHILVVPFFDNVMPAWESQLDLLDEQDRQAPMLSWLGKLELALHQARSIGRVTVAGAHLWNANGYRAAAESLNDFNDALRASARKHANVNVVDTAAIVARIGEGAAFDARFYYRGKAPYTPKYLDELARRVALSTRGFSSYFYKVIALDCDNTLWGGIIGEDGIAGIALDPYSYPGNVYWVVQQKLRQLESRGILLCLCSKNNAADAEEVFANHPNAALHDDDFAAKRLNWEPKVANLRALAAELNLGLDSFIFIDDSSFEIDSVRQQLPQVQVFQVPSKLVDYPAMLDEIADLCAVEDESPTNASRTEQYRQLAQAAAEQQNFDSHEDYLRSLNLEVTVYRDCREHVARIAELTQKSNQFNLTTRRYTPGQITALMDREEAAVYSFAVKDRFGDCGITGVLVVDATHGSADVDAFLMSCRVIGRGIEFAVWRAVLDDLRRQGATGFSASYLPTPKNAQVADFFDRLGMTLSHENDNGDRRYYSNVDGVQIVDGDWVELIVD